MQARVPRHRWCPRVCTVVEFADWLLFQHCCAELGRGNVDIGAEIGDGRTQAEEGLSTDLERYATPWWPDQRSLTALLCTLCGARTEQMYLQPAQPFRTHSLARVAPVGYLWGYLRVGNHRLVDSNGYWTKETGVRSIALYLRHERMRMNCSA
jgi:hypothetical protein